MKVSTAGPLQVEGTAGGETLRQRAALVNLRTIKEARRLLAVSGGELWEVRWEDLRKPQQSDPGDQGSHEGVECLSGILGMQQALTRCSASFLASFLVLYKS